MQKAQDYYPDCPEAFLVSLARTGDRKAFAEIVQRRQSQVRNLMRRCCNDYTLADDLTQQVFLKVWLSIRKLRKASAFSGWLKRIAVSVWLQHIRKKDALGEAGEMSGSELAKSDTTGMVLDLDRALVRLSNPVRLCVVLSYNEGMSHREIAEITGLPLLEFAILISQFLTMALFDLGEGWLALALMPLNNIASLMVISAKAIHLGWKKLTGASFAH